MWGAALTFAAAAALAAVDAPTSAGAGAGVASESGELRWPGAAAVDAQDFASLDRGQRRRAVERLAMRRDPEIRAGLVTLLSDPDRDVRLAAAKVLARLTAPEAIDAAVRWATGAQAGDRPAGLDVLREVAGPLPAAARRAVERSLRDSEPTIRFLAMDVLSRQDAGASFVAIAAAVDDDNREVRLRAIRLLARSKDGRAALALLPRLNDSDRQVRVSAIQALAETGDRGAGAALLRQLGDPVDEVRLASIEALGRLRIADAVPALIALGRRRPADDVTHEAALALGDIASPAAIAALIDLLREPPVTNDAREALRRAGAAAIPALLDEAADGPPTGSAAAVSLLGQVRGAGGRPERRVVKALAAIVERRGSATLAALEALAALGDPDASLAVMRAAADPAPEVRRSAWAALVAIADDRTLPAVERGLSDADPRIRRLALQLAVAAGARAPALLAAVRGRLADGDAGVRNEAAAALVRLQPVAGGPAALLALLDRNPDDAAAADALEAAARKGDDAILLAGAARARGRARGALARAFAAAHAAQPAAPLTDAGAIDFLFAVLADGGTNAEDAAEALGEARLPPARREALLRLFDGGAEPGVRARLCAALAAPDDAAGPSHERLARAIADEREARDVRAAAAWAAGRAPGPRDARPGREALRRALEGAARGGDPAVAANARAALAAADGAARARRDQWTAARVTGGGEGGGGGRNSGGGDPIVRRWITVTSADGTTVWVETGLGGRARAGGLPPGPYAIRLAEPGLEVRAAE